jgi:hypothetical protein
MNIYINIFTTIFLIIYFIDLFIIKKIYVENLYLKKMDSSALRSANNDLPIMPSDGYNTVPSDLMRQYANISGHYYK